MCIIFFFYGYGYHLDLHVRTHSFPPRRSSDLACRDSAVPPLHALDEPARHARRVECDDARNHAQGRSGRCGRTGRRGGSAMSVLKQNARSEEHTSELQSLMRISYAVFCLKKKKKMHRRKK